MKVKDIFTLKDDITVIVCLKNSSFNACLDDLNTVAGLRFLLKGKDVEPQVVHIVNVRTFYNAKLNMDCIALDTKDLISFSTPQLKTEQFDLEYIPSSQSI